MKPLNYDDPGCNYTTSNCVIWQGPDIPCISLCKGDTVTDVIYKLAKELCDVLEVLNISTYDLSCLNVSAGSISNFEELIQFLINKICGTTESGGVIVTNPGPVNQDDDNESQLRTGFSNCPDCVVTIAPCFYYVNEFGDTVTSMQLSDYVRAIGNKVCNNVNAILQQQAVLDNHESRIKALEDAPEPVFETPEMVPTTVLPPLLTPIDEVLIALEAQFGELRSATGLPASIFTNLAKQPAALNSEKTLDGSGNTMASLPGWASTVSSIAQSMGNLWLTIQDMRTAVRTIQLNCCPSGCDGILLDLYANLTGDTINIFVSGTIPEGFVECSGISIVKITDSSGNSIQFNYSLITYLNNPTGFPYNLSGTPINLSLDLTVEILPCLSNASTGTECQSCLVYNITNQASCPLVTYTTDTGSISYQFNSNPGDYTYTIEVWNSSGTTMIANQIQAISGVQIVVGQIVGLSAGTLYKVRLSIQPTACPECEPSQCPFDNVTTTLPPCIPPSGVSAEITIP